MTEADRRAGEQAEGSGLDVLRSYPTAELVLARLSVGYSPRKSPVEDSHVRLLMEVIDQLPPIVVHGETMTVIDGVHRLEAFRRAGRSRISAVVFKGDRQAALALAVEANVRHGKPLTNAERRAAARAILTESPERSDRWVGHTCGLSHTTVGRLRNEVGGGADEPTVRVGRDGRRRPIDPHGPRSQVAKAMAEQPGATLRDAAESAGVSVSTAHAVASRRRSPRVGAGPRARPGTDDPRPGAERSPPWAIADDPALRSSPELAEFSGWLTRTQVAADDISPYLATLPVGRRYDVADECRRRAKAWFAIADSVEYGPNRSGQH